MSTTYDYARFIKKSSNRCLNEVVNMKVIGIHDGHNASACLINDGKIVYCIQEERLTNEKNYYGFPEKSLKEILKITNLEIKNIDKFAYASNHTAIGEFK